MIEIEENAKEPMTIRLVDMCASGHFVTDVYVVSGDPRRRMFVTRPMVGLGGTEITIWGEPRRMWNGVGTEFEKIGYKIPLPPLNDEKREALALLFQKLGISPPASNPAPVTAVGEYQI